MYPASLSRCVITRLELLFIRIAAVKEWFGNMNNTTVLCGGLPVSSGIAFGKVRKLVKASGQRIDKNDILVLYSSDPTFAPDVMQAGGMIVEIGGRLAHLCVIALEMGIPCITQVDNAMEILSDGQEIFLDAGEGKVYAME
jgi:phosphohistidine swiveling domain-containing protein